MESCCIFKVVKVIQHSKEKFQIWLTVGPILLFTSFDEHSFRTKLFGALNCFHHAFKASSVSNLINTLVST